MISHPYLRIISVLLILFLSASCESAGVDSSSPTDSLLVTVLSDLYLTEAEIQLIESEKEDVQPTSENVDRTQANHIAEAPESTSLRDSILATHNLTSDEFDTLLRAYVEQPDELQRLYDRVLDKLNLERQQLRSQ